MSTGTRSINSRDQRVIGSLESVPRRRPPIFDTLRHLSRNRGAAIGAVLLVLLALMAVFAPLIAPYSPIKQNFQEVLKSPSLKHLLGTDNFGRDVLSRIMYGARLSLSVGIIAAGIGAGLGVIFGLISGYYGGWIDSIIMRIMDAMLAFPGILMAMTVVAILGSGLVNVMVAVGIASVPTFARLVRGSVLSARQNDYVEAAHVVGCRSGRIMMRHILPNVFAPLLTLTTLRVSRAILSAAALNFLGLGAQPPIPEWGVMLANGRNYLRGYWWLATFPGLAIMITTLSINMLGDGLRDVLDPRLRQD